MVFPVRSHPAFPGRSVNRGVFQLFFGGIQWKSIPVNIDDIERIEVSRGPNLATYGSNTFQAAINIITRTAAEDQGSFVRSNIGNHEIADLTYRYGSSSGNFYEIAPIKISLC